MLNIVYCFKLFNYLSNTFLINQLLIYNLRIEADVRSGIVPYIIIVHSWVFFSWLSAIRFFTFAKFLLHQNSFKKKIYESKYKI